MTVKELIEHLQTLDPEIRVFTEGYEGGYNDVKIGGPFEIALDVYHDWWYGKHEKASKFIDKSKYKLTKGIVL